MKNKKTIFCKILYDNNNVYKWICKKKKSKMV